MRHPRRLTKGGVCKRTARQGLAGTKVLGNLRFGGLAVSLAPMLRVLVVDDLAEVRTVVRTALRLRSQIEIVGEATTTFSAVELAADLRPDVVVLDLLLPDSAQGRDTYQRLHAASPESRLVIYTGHDTDPGWYRTQGAAGFVDKGTGINQLVEAVEHATPAA